MISGMRQSEIDSVMEIWLEGNLQAHSFIDGQYFVRNIGPVRNAIRDAQVFVYEKDGQIAGFAGLVQDEVAGLFVRQSERSRGIGKALLHTARQHGGSWLRVYEKNVRAVQFYLREGFCVAQRGTDPATGEAELLLCLPEGIDRRMAGG